MNKNFTANKSLLFKCIDILAVFWGFAVFKMMLLQILIGMEVKSRIFEHGQQCGDPRVRRYNGTKW